jgi:hypothetical protein
MFPRESAFAFSCGCYAETGMAGTGRVQKLADIRKSAMADVQQPILLSGAISLIIR